MLALTTAIELPTRLAWNASASMSIGPYAVLDDDRVRPGVTVLVEPPEPLAAFLGDGGYLPRGVPLLKRVEALSGATVSRADTIGLMQVMPGTYAELRARYGLGADPFDVRDNVLAGTAYLREMHDRYGVQGMLAASLGCHKEYARIHSAMSCSVEPDSALKRPPCRSPPS
ncbi:transglycosylase SLT domain-containing protein [Phenylobacterium sp. J367]|uniref:transglycosylase SLT domain-containing protein n=1 Tax=Phenylobacterium sp. J367 TaxID=2898435 RepID=UPI0021507545|nr:transglycosylase SLT domain-containing protein [Phenylobacterium sp. J367]MCR5881293.1 transglycosylase SLT domain-containing protein [Phenylobacterium sp. J367]